MIHGIKDDNKPYKSIFVNPTEEKDSRFVVNNNRLSHLVDVVAQWHETIRKSQGFIFRVREQYQFTYRDYCDVSALRHEAWMTET